MMELDAQTIVANQSLAEALDRLDVVKNIADNTDVLSTTEKMNLRDAVRTLERIESRLMTIMAKRQKGDYA